MSLIGTALGIIADVITDTVRTNQTKKKVDKLKLSIGELDEEYEREQKYDFINTSPAKEIIEKVDKKKSTLEASGDSVFNYQAAPKEQQIAKAAKYNVEYNDAIKEVLAVGVKKREAEKKEYLRNRQLIENKIFNTETSKNGGSDFKVNVDFKKQERFI